jgi:hypothetical protein
VLPLGTTSKAESKCWLQIVRSSPSHYSLGGFVSNHFGLLTLL